MASAQDMDGLVMRGYKGRHEPLQKLESLIRQETGAGILAVPKEAVCFITASAFDV